ncbi:MAG: hypothetical protein WDZ46_05190 [Solirubrobacterales bacterium]|jgi:hypothetical protein
MKTFRLDPTVGDKPIAVVEEVDKLLREGKRVVVTVVEKRESLPRRQADRQIHLEDPS